MQGFEEEEILDRPETIVLDRLRWCERPCPPPGREANRQMQPRLLGAARKRPSCDVIRCRPVPGSARRNIPAFQLTVRPLFAAGSLSDYDCEKISQR